MNPWICALLITTAGAIGGVVNALMSDNGFILPRLKKGIMCPGFISNIFIGALSAFSSWSFYGSGASVASWQFAVGLNRPGRQLNQNK